MSDQPIRLKEIITSRAGILLLAFGIAVGMIGTFLLYEYDLKQKRDARLERLMNGPQSWGLPQACIFRSGPEINWYSDINPQRMCTWVEDPDLPRGGCWRMKDKELCWTGRGWISHE